MVAGVEWFPPASPGGCPELYGQRAKQHCQTGESREDKVLQSGSLEQGHGTTGCREKTDSWLLWETTSYKMKASMDSMATELTNWPGETPRDKAEGTPKNLQADRDLMGSLAHYRLQERYIWVNIIATEERSRGLQNRNTRSQETTTGTDRMSREEAKRVRVRHLCDRPGPRGFSSQEMAGVQCDSYP